MNNAGLQKDFSETRWSLILSAASDSEGGARALATLCEAYWYPLYAFARRQGLSAHDAEDTTQSFFVHLLSKNVFAKADQTKGRFRTFLLASMKNFLADEHGRANAIKRGRGLHAISFDSCDAEERYAMEPVDSLSPDRLFDRRWALTAISQAFERLEGEYKAAGKVVLFTALKPLLTSGGSALSYAEIAIAVNLSEGALKVAVHRLRQRYGAALRAVILETVANREDVEPELRHLLTSL